ncbi:MAG: SagB/ThcOx family dehydrogenase [Elainella sp.]
MLSSAFRQSSLSRDASRSLGEYHEATKHSVLSVQLDPNYVDSRTQPALYKCYPHFFRRFPLDPDQPLQQLLTQASAITYHKQYRDTVHLLRVQPSAGALYPTELYVQLRGIRGMLDGIYHLEPDTNTLTLLYELIDDGLEGYLPDSRLITGCILLISCVYFRSSWKYKNRSLRYCFLDSGHHLGAVEAAAYVNSFPYQLLFEFDQQALNADLGFENQEFVTAAVVIGEAKAKPVRRLRTPLPIVAGTDYFEPNRLIEAGYRQSFVDQSFVDQSVPLQPPPGLPRFPFPAAQWQEAIQQRRSARRFYPQPIEQAALLTIWAALQQPVPGQPNAILEINAVVQRVAGLEPGLYRDGWTEAQRLKAGEFQDQTGFLCINQAIARDSAVVFFITADWANYRVALQQAGLIGQRIYLAATALGLGCSGIGAFYDDETQAFLETEQAVLYAVAVGQVTGQATRQATGQANSQTANQPIALAPLPSSPNG